MERCSGDLKENKIKRAKDRGSGCCVSEQGSRGGAEIRVCRRKRKKREGKKKGRADSYFSTVATGLRGILTIHSSLSYSHKWRTNKVPGDLQQHAAHHPPAHVTPEVRCAPALLILPLFFNRRHFFPTNTVQGQLFLHLPATMTKWTKTGSKQHEDKEGCQ